MIGVRKKGFCAYQLAVVVDDIDKRISHVVRGSDLLPLTAQQQQIFRAWVDRRPGCIFRSFSTTKAKPAASPRCGD